MKYLLVILAALSIGNILNAQKYVIEWADTIDETYWGFMYDVAVDDLGNVYIAGYSRTVPISQDYRVVKYNSGGSIIWADTLDMGANDEAQCMAVDHAGNIYVAGGSDFGGDDDYLTVKLDTAGNVLWADTIDHGLTEYAYGITVDNSNNIYVTGHSTYDCFTVKYDTGGFIVWADTLDNGSNECAFDIVVDDIGNIYVTGYAHGTYFDKWFTVKYDSVGNILWADTLDYGDNCDGVAYGVTADDRGNVYVTGRYRLNSDYDYLTVKYDSVGNITWADTLDNGDLDIAYGIALDKIGNIFVSGISYIDTTYDYFVVKYDTGGFIVWADTIDSGDYDNAYSIAVDSSGNVYVTGTFHSDYLTVKYAKYKDVGILSILSPPDTASTDSSYTPSIWVKNNSYETALSFDVQAAIDSAGSYIYNDTQTVSNLSSGDSTLVSFGIWNTPSNPVDLLSRFYIIIPDMNSVNDSISKLLYVRDLTAPVIDSAVAYDGADSLGGIDADDYVILYFSEPTNMPLIDSTNIDSIFSLSGSHSWLDGAGRLGVYSWDSSGTELLINLTINLSLPTIAVGDTITPNSITITDLNGNPCSGSVILTGSFGYVSRVDENIPDKAILSVPLMNLGEITFSYGIAANRPYTVILYSIDGRAVKKLEGEKAGYYEEKISDLPSGLYFLRLNQEGETTNRKIVLVR